MKEICKGDGGDKLLQPNHGQNSSCVVAGCVLDIVVKTTRMAIFPTTGATSGISSMAARTSISSSNYSINEDYFI